MNRHPIELLEPVFRWPDWLIAEHGHQIYLVMVWTSPFLIAWILRGGFWRKRQRRPILVAPVLLVPIASPPSQAVPPPLPLTTLCLRTCWAAPPTTSATSSPVCSVFLTR